MSDTGRCGVVGNRTRVLGVPRAGLPLVETKPTPWYCSFMTVPIRPELKHDSSAQASYLKLAQGDVSRSFQVSTDLVVDVDSDGYALGVEFLGVGPSIGTPFIREFTR